jgi:hypothetical protein
LSKPSADNLAESSLALIAKQRSHVLFVLSNPRAAQAPTFLNWYQRSYFNSVLSIAGVLAGQHYERHEVDITRGQHAPLPFGYLGVFDISLDGVQAADRLINRIERLHREEDAAEAPATWLYYPVSEKVGRSPAVKPSMLTLAFANGAAGKETEFREWYATLHIRHALNISALVSGQCFARTQFQRPGAMLAAFDTIALYEQEGSPESIIESFSSLPQDLFRFPSLDTSRFAESVYRPL